MISAKLKTPLYELLEDCQLGHTQLVREADDEKPVNGREEKVRR